MEAEHYVNQVTDSNKEEWQCHPDTSCEGSNQGGSPGPGPVCFLHLPDGEGQGERGISTYHQPKTFE